MPNAPETDFAARLSAMPPPLEVALGDGVRPMVFRPVPPGRFRMGSRDGDDVEQPVHTVEIAIPSGSTDATPAFWLGETPVTQAQFDVWTRATGEQHVHHFAGNPDHPAENMDWDQARAFCAWLTDSGRLPEGLQAELPTEAQWEYACRAGTETEHHSGDGTAALDRAGWYGEGWGKGAMHAVGLKEPNAFGLYDMHGNVDEWCLDEWDEAAYRRRPDGVRNPQVGDPEDSAACRVVRGGSWILTAGWCRSACRFGWSPLLRAGFRGFRVALLPRSGASDVATKAASGGVRG